MNLQWSQLYIMDSGVFGKSLITSKLYLKASLAQLHGDNFFSHSGVNFLDLIHANWKAILSQKASINF